MSKQGPHVLGQAGGGGHMCMLRVAPLHFECHAPSESGYLFESHLRSMSGRCQCTSRRLANAHSTRAAHAERIHPKVMLGLDHLFCRLVVSCALDVQLIARLSLRWHDRIGWPGCSANAFGRTDGICGGEAHMGILLIEQ